jgi:hypothetical protein
MLWYATTLPHWTGVEIGIEREAVWNTWFLMKCAYGNLARRNGKSWKFRSSFSCQKSSTKSRQPYEVPFNTEALRHLPQSTRVINQLTLWRCSKTTRKHRTQAHGYSVFQCHFRNTIVDLQSTTPQSVLTPFSDHLHSILRPSSLHSQTIFTPFSDHLHSILRLSHTSPATSHTLTSPHAYPYHPYTHAHSERKVWLCLTYHSKWMICDGKA